MLGDDFMIYNGYAIHHHSPGLFFVAVTEDEPYEPFSRLSDAARYIDELIPPSPERWDVYREEWQPEHDGGGGYAAIVYVDTIRLPRGTSEEDALREANDRFPFLVGVEEES